MLELEGFGEGREGEGAAQQEEGLLLRRVKVSMARRGQLEQREGVLVEPQQPQKQAKRWMLGV